MLILYGKISGHMKFLNPRQHRQRGFTIVELLIVIVVIAILAAISVVAYNGIQARSATAKRDADISQYYKAILLARESSGKTLNAITGSNYSLGSCLSTNNPDGTEPKDLPKTSQCWLRYYDNLSKIGVATGVNLDNLKSGDARGNPYMLDENEGEQGCPSKDVLYYFTGSGVSSTVARMIPRFDGCS